MKNVHLVIADLFLPKEYAAGTGLHLPALEKILARGASTARTDMAGRYFEDALCEIFKVEGGLAPVSAAFDALAPGCWLRADPVHVRLQREQVVLLPVNVCEEEAALFCASLNEHFKGQGMEFFAPHPQRWYVQLDAQPDIVTVPLSQAVGRNMHGNLPAGPDARRWHQLFNEIQMLLFAHPLNESREARGEMPVNSVWFWGGGCEHKASAVPVFDCASSDEVLVEMLSSEAGTSFVPWQPVWRENAGVELLVFTGLRSSLQRGDLGAWYDALERFETAYAAPLWQALRAGKIDCLTLDVLGGDGRWHTSLTRGDAWAFWRRAVRLADYSAKNVI